MIQKKCNIWDARFFTMADFIASWSEDQSRKVGCVIVGKSNEIRSTGYNGLPRGVDSTKEIRHTRSEGKKYLWYEHAERNAIYNLARTSASAEGCRMYCNSYPCADCARAIIQSGITELCTFAFDPEDKNFKQHFYAAKEMFEEAKIIVNIYSRRDEKILDIVNTFKYVIDDKNNLLR